MIDREVREIINNVASGKAKIKGNKISYKNNNGERMTYTEGDETLHFLAMGGFDKELDGEERRALDALFVSDDSDDEENEEDNDEE